MTFTTRPTDCTPKTEGRIKPNGEVRAAKRMLPGRGADWRKMRAAAWEKVIQLKLIGKTQREIALVTGFGSRTISTWYKNPEFALKLKRSKALLFEGAQTVIDAEHTSNQMAKKAIENVEQLIEDFSVRAIKVIADKMELGGSATMESVALRAAIDLADRGPKTGKTKKVQTMNLHALVTPESLATAMLTAQEISEDRKFGHVVEPVDFNTIDIQALEADESDDRSAD